MTQGRYLIGGDAEVGVWDRIWDHNKNQSDRLAYDVLIAPHHCSWHSLSYDSWSDLGEEGESVRAGAQGARPSPFRRADRLQFEDASATTTTIRRACAPSANTRTSCRPRRANSAASPTAPATGRWKSRCLAAGSKGEARRVRGDRRGRNGDRQPAFRARPFGRLTLRGVEIPRAVLRALRLIEAHDSVVSVDARRDRGQRCRRCRRRDEDGAAEFLARGGQSPSGVRAIEPVTFVFGAELPVVGAERSGCEWISIEAIRTFSQAIRGDRPEPCLIAGSPRELLRTRGILGLVEQLAEWLERAAFVQLIDPSQGWEPTRRDHIEDVIIADGAWLTGIADPDRRMSCLQDAVLRGRRG